MAAMTLKTIAEQVGVSVSTVSEVLRYRSGKARFSEETKRKVLKAAKSLNYEPQAAARALVTGKSYNIGFLLSANSTLGLANFYYASLLSGVQDLCKTRGYDCIVSEYDLASVDFFVVPSKVSRKKVDGVIIAGYAQDDVVQKFVDYDIPFVIIGENSDFPRGGILSVSNDMIVNFLKAFDYLYSLGHRDFGVGTLDSIHSRMRYEEAVRQFRMRHPGETLRFHAYLCDDCPNVNKFDFAEEKAAEWLRLKDRPTAIVGHDQFCTGFMAGAIRGGAKCPEDFSLISTCDTVLTQRGIIGMTALQLPLVENGSAVAQLLIDYIEKKTNWIEVNRLAEELWKKCELIVRSSTGPTKTK